MPIHPEDSRCPHCALTLRACPEPSCSSLQYCWTCNICYSHNLEGETSEIYVERMYVIARTSGYDGVRSFWNGKGWIPISKNATLYRSKDDAEVVASSFKDAKTFVHLEGNRETDQKIDV